MAKGRHSFKEVMFSEVNPAIEFFRKTCLFIIFHFPDLSHLEGLKLTALRILYIFIAVSMIGWLLTEGITPLNVLIKGIIFTLIIGAIHIHMFASTVYAFLYVWENKGMEIFK